MNNILAVFAGVMFLNVLAGRIAIAQDGGIKQDDGGRIFGNLLKVSKPIEEHDLSQLVSVQSLAVLPDGKKAVVHGWIHDGNATVERIVVLDIASSVIERVLLDSRSEWVERLPQMRITSDGKSALIADSSGITVVDLASGNAKRRPSGRDMPVAWYAFCGDGSKATAVLEDQSVGILWDFHNDTKQVFNLPAKLNRPGVHSAFFPLPARQDLLGVSRGTERPNGQVYLFDPKTSARTALAEHDETLGILPTWDGKRAFLFRQQDPNTTSWTAIEEWDLVTAKLQKAQALKPPVSAGTISISQDGDTLFMQEDTTQSIVVRDLKGGKYLAVLGPEGGGCQAFDTTPDGSRVIAMVGLWKQGTLTANTLAVYDTSKFVSPQKH